MTIQSKRLSIIFIVTMSILLIPLIAMQFTNEVNWSLFDFLIAGALLIGTGLACNFVLTSTPNKRKRVLIIAGILLVLALIFASSIKLVRDTFAHNKFSI
mgnify:CR=1 FL=1